MSDGGRGRGRGAYYKAKYGGGGRGRGGRGGGGRVGFREEEGSLYSSQGQGRQQAGGEQQDAGGASDDGGYGAEGPASSSTGSGSDLAAALQRIDGRGYKAYKDIEGRWQMAAQQGGYCLCVDWVQGDPFASPSKCRVVLPAALAALPAQLVCSRTRRTAVCDYLTRSFGAAVAASGGDIRQQSGGWQGEKGGEMSVDKPGQHVLERTSVLILADGSVEARFTVALPARGRSVLGQWASSILLQNLPRYVHQGLQYAQQDRHALQCHVECVEDTQSLRDQLPALGLVSFLGDGSILPRKSGASDEPMAAAEAVPFRSPEALAVTVQLPNRGAVRGLGIRRGITLVVGGGFHGKSTVLEAIECGVYNKIPGDGRELIATDPCAVKIRAEDGRRVESVNISPFLSNLPFGKDTRCFQTPDASGSTSQAANIQEALEVGASTLLIDEDKVASNAMTRDARMLELVSGNREPITPFICKLPPLAALGVSCILVIGGSGQYFDVADTVICMDAYVPSDATAAARAISARHAGTGDRLPRHETYGDITPRTLASVHPRPVSAHGRDLRVKTRTLHCIQLDQEEELDLSAVEQLVEVSQTRAIADALVKLRGALAGRGGPWTGRPLTQVLDALEAEMDERGVDALAGRAKPGNLARPRRFELAAAVNRLRTAQLRQLA
ncbi:hypothetical protein D9Q98_007902 [Chlorella vulgaris]|uniref:Uncharacterized protein n=1 Tax=Chlorella vulgaris TaxID=3077 RepID=A0A9D4THT5_CHLVU|nr:hypothetical protein D9Q98_007902 [Chlorella vulgaris]